MTLEQYRDMRGGFALPLRGPVRSQPEPVLPGAMLDDLS